MLILLPNRRNPSLDLKFMCQSRGYMRWHFCIISDATFLESNCPTTLTIHYEKVVKELKEVQEALKKRASDD